MKVLNIKNCDYKVPNGAVYIGRAMPQYNLPASKWANPYIIGRDGNRKRVVERYQERLGFLLTHTGSRESLLRDLEELRGKDLVCWCNPLPCHGDILLELANKETIK